MALQILKGKPTALHHVVSGQQAMFLGGPLFLLSKLVGVCHLAHQKKSTPVLWIETNDSDFNEVKDCFILTKDDTRSAVSYPEQSPLILPRTKHDGNLRIGDYPITEKTLQKIEALFTLLPKEKDSQELKNLLLQSHSLGPHVDFLASEKGSLTDFGNAVTGFFFSLTKKGQSKMGAGFTHF